jgi:pimeloyl-ACP methyl ester carboxylesterase/DNA-binding CsgD family transcriptional regulator
MVHEIPKPEGLPVTRVRTRYARNEASHIAYQAVGQGPVDVVFLPGFPSNLDVLWEDAGFSRLIRRLSSFSRVLAVDRRGMGLSDAIDLRHPPDPDQHAEDVSTVMVAAGSARAALFAATDDVPTALAFAARYPQRTRCLVLYGGRAGQRDPLADGESTESGQADVASTWGHGETVRLFAPSRAADAAFVDWWARLERLSASPAAARVVASAHATVDVGTLLSRIAVPTLVLHRRRDCHVPLSEGISLAAGIAGASLVDLPGKDHTVWVGAVDEIADAVEVFVTGSKNPAAGRVLTTLLVLRIVNAERMAASLGAFGWREVQERLSALAGRLAGDDRRRQPPALPGEIRIRFDRPTQAISGAEALRRDVAALSLHVGIGIHTAEFDVNKDGLVGIGTLIAERIAAMAGRDEILVSAPIVDLVIGSGVRSSPAGFVRIDGLEAPIGVFRIDAEQHLEPCPKTNAPDLDVLTMRERQVLRHVARGLSNASVGLELGISEHTVKRHVANILDKLDLPTRAAAAGLVARDAI